MSYVLRWLLMAIFMITWVCTVIGAPFLGVVGGVAVAMASAWPLGVVAGLALFGAASAFFWFICRWAMDASIDIDQAHQFRRVHQLRRMKRS